MDLDSGLDFRERRYSKTIHHEIEARLATLGLPSRLLEVRFDPLSICSTEMPDFSVYELIQAKWLTPLRTSSRQASDLSRYMDFWDRLTGWRVPYETGFLSEIRGGESRGSYELIVATIVQSVNPALSRSATHPVTGPIHINYLLTIPEWHDLWVMGLWRLYCRKEKYIGLWRPTVARDANDRIHSETGPAISWHNGAGYYFWHGTEVPSEVVLTPSKLDWADAMATQNMEIRRIIIERIGFERCVSQAGQLVAIDAVGALYDLPVNQSAVFARPIRLVQVQNATPNGDGTRDVYYLRVPPTIQTPRAAVAWTFGLTEAEYYPTLET